MHTYHIPLPLRFQWLNSGIVVNILARLLASPKKGRKGYDKVWMLRWIMVKQLTGMSYRDIASMTGTDIDHSTFVKFKRRLITHNKLARMFQFLITGALASLTPLNLVLDSSFVQTYSKKQELGSAYSGYKQKNGFKVHQIIDEGSRLPLRQAATDGAAADIVWGRRLIRSGPASWNVRSLVADKGYDADDFVHQIKQKWKDAQVGIPIRATSQKSMTRDEQRQTLNYRLKAKPRTLTKKLLNTRTEIERYFSRKKRVFRLGEERTRHLKNFRANCYLTAIMEVLEWLSKNPLLRVLFT